MKIRNNLFFALLGFSILPACLMLITQMLIFTKSDVLAFSDLAFPFIYQLISTYIICFVFFARPIEHFLNSIKRSIKGDYRARFSCSDFNELSRISDAYNQLMSTVEQHTEELKQNRLLQNQLYENEKIYRSALELTSERLFEADLTHNRLDYGLDSYIHFFPFLDSEMFSQIIKSISQNAIFSDDREKYYDTFCRENLIKMFTTKGVQEISLDFRQLGANNCYYWVTATIIHLSNTNHDTLKIIGYVKNIDDHKRNELEILKQSQKDSLTGLYNKKVTQSLIEDYICGNGSDKKNALIMMDIDNFKSINDTYGHIQGDDTLIELSEKLPYLFRSSDIIGRIGGDEFFILLKDFVSDEQLIAKLTSLCNMFGEMRIGEDHKQKISGSIGVSIFPTDGTTYHDLYKKADISLYYAKEHGKSCFYIYNNCIGDHLGSKLIEPVTIDMSGYQKYATKNISAEICSCK